MNDMLAINAAGIAADRPRGIDGPAPALRPLAEEKELAAARQFETLFVKQLVQMLRASASAGGEGSMFGEGPGSDTYAQWFDNNMSEHLAEGDGIGIASMLVRQFEDARVRRATPLRAPVLEPLEIDRPGTNVSVVA